MRRGVPTGQASVKAAGELSVGCHFGRHRAGTGGHRWQMSEGPGQSRSGVYRRGFSGLAGNPKEFASIAAVRRATPCVPAKLILKMQSGRC